jgi:phage baseplate assembly protein V
MRRMNGVVIGLVKDIDPNEGRVKVAFPWLGEEDSAWAPVASLMAGKQRGAWFMPEIGDEALVAFEHGDFDHPFIVGFLWNGVDAPPRSDPHRRIVRSVNGHEIEIYDPEVTAGDRGYIRLKDAHGNMVELANAHITIRSVAAVDIQAPSVTINGRLVAPVPNPI